MILLIAFMFFVLFVCLGAIGYLIKKIMDLNVRFDKVKKEMDWFHEHEDTLCRIHDLIYGQYLRIEEAYGTISNQYKIMYDSYELMSAKLENAEKRYSEAYEEFKYCKNRLDLLTKEEEPYAGGSEMVRPDMSA